MGVPAAMRPCNGISIASLRRRHGADCRRRYCRRRRTTFRHLENFQGSRPVGQAADEAAFLSAEIRRCTPDFDLRSSASRISSKLGLMPLS